LLRKSLPILEAVLEPAALVRPAILAETAGILVAAQVAPAAAAVVVFPHHHQVAVAVAVAAATGLGPNLVL
jgi:hypothetical protein